MLPLHLMLSRLYKQFRGTIEEDEECWQHCLQTFMLLLSYNDNTGIIAQCVEFKNSCNVLCEVSPQCFKCDELLWR